MDGIPHDLTVDSYLPALQGELPTFNMNNNWGAEKDARFDSAYSLYDLLLNHKNLKEIATEVKPDGGVSDFNNSYKQLADLQSMHKDGTLNNTDFSQAVVSQMEAMKLQDKLYPNKNKEGWEKLKEQLKKVQQGMSKDKYYWQVDYALKHEL